MKPGKLFSIFAALAFAACMSAPALGAILHRAEERQLQRHQDHVHESRTANSRTIWKMFTTFHP